jgi:cell filamentation protein, protein adenylyltransferase
VREKRQVFPDILDAMDIERLGASPIGRLVPIVGPDPVTHETVEGKAYLPDPLPPDLTLSTTTWTTINAATAALARLDGAARLIPAPALLRRPALRREAQSTSALEGTYAPFADVLAAERDGQERLSAELWEVLNFEQMAELAFSWPEARPLSLGMLGELQKTLVHGTPGELSDAGGLRDRIVVIGAPGHGIAEARFVPPPPGDQLRLGLEILLQWIESPPGVPTVVQAALTHYQFEALHPYSDGNGRLGRLLIIVQILRGALIREPLLVVSPWFEERREQYQNALLELSANGDWDAWVAFFAEGVAASAAGSQDKVERLVTLQGELRAAVQGAGKRGVAEQLAADLVGSPFVTRSQVEKNYGLSRQGAWNAINALVDLGILEIAQLHGPRGARYFVAPQVVQIASA